MPAAFLRARRFVTRLSTDRGAVAVEFALVLPLFLILVFGIIDFSRAYNAQITLTEAAAEAARAVAVTTPTSSTADPVALSAAHSAAAATVAGSTVKSGDLIYEKQVTCQTLSPTGATSNAQVGLRIHFTYTTPLPGLAKLAPFDITAMGVRQCSG